MLDARRIMLFAVEMAALKRMGANPQKMTVVIAERDKVLDSLVLTQSPEGYLEIAKDRALSQFGGPVGPGSARGKAITIGVKGFDDQRDTEIASMAIAKAQEKGLV